MAAREQLIIDMFTEASRAGSFGGDVVDFVGFKSGNDKAVTAHYLSAVEFGEVTLEMKNSEQVVQPVLIKTQIRAAPFPSRATSNDIFHNEVSFYTKVAPLLQKYDTCNVLSTSFPELVYGKAIGKPEEDVVVLKDLRQKGFQPCVPDNLDERHIELVLDRLGKFHALSFLCKLKDPIEFEEVASQMREVDLLEPMMVFGGFVSKETFREGMFRGIKPLQKEAEYREKLTELSANCDNAHDLLGKYRYDSSHLGIMAHGDFRVTNMMFKYQSDGTPFEVVFFDFQMMAIGPPAVDVCLFMMFEVPAELRRARWEKFLHVYHDAVSYQMREHCNEIPSMETIELNIRKRGIFAYYFYAILWPNMLSDKNGLGMISPPKKEDLNEEEVQKTMETYLQSLREWGGPKVTKMLAEAVRFMIDKKFIFEY